MNTPKPRSPLRVCIYLLIIFFTLELLLESSIWLGNRILKKGEPSVARHLLLLRPLSAQLPIEKFPKSLPGIRYLGDFHDPIWGEVIEGRFHPPDAMLGWRNAPLSSVIQRIDSAKSDTWSWRFTDEHGFMSISDLPQTVSQEKKAGVFRVVIFGGSTVEGVGAESPSQSLPAFLRKELEKKRPNSAIEVLNAGVGGYFSFLEYPYLITRVSAFDPDLVTFYDGWNDSHYVPVNIQNSSSAQTNAYITPAHLINAHASRRAFTGLGSVRLFLQMATAYTRFWVSQTAVGFLMNKLLHPSSLAAQDGVSIESRQAAAHAFAENIERGILFSKQKKFRVAYFLQPLMGVDDRQYTREEQIYFDQDKNQISARQIFYPMARTLFKDLSDKYAKPGQVCIQDVSMKTLSEVPGQVYSDSGHLLGKGNEKMAEVLVNQLSKCGLLSK